MNHKRDGLQEAQFKRHDQTWHVSFCAMANPCSILFEGCTEAVVQTVSALMIDEVKRIEKKYSRYRSDSVLSIINASAGKRCSVDKETWHLLNLAGILWQQSEGRFDSSSGVLAKLWPVNKSSSQPRFTLPIDTEIQRIRLLVGWQKTQLDEQSFQMQSGMQIDFGGIGKEYAADQCAAIASLHHCQHCLINLGGDVVSTGKRANGNAWGVGIEAQRVANKAHAIWKTIPLTRGAIATSGDTHHFIEHEGRRYSHILDARSGWPVEQVARSITVAAPTALEAGMLTTLALLFCEQGEAFLQKQGRPYWIQY